MMTSQGRWTSAYTEVSNVLKLDPHPIKIVLSTSLLGLRAPLANLKLGVALANHVDAAAPTHDLAVWVAIL